MVPEGRAVEFHCNSASTPVWSHEGGDLSRDVLVSQDGGSIGIRKAMEKDAGLYECHGQTSDGEVFVSMGRLIIQSKYEPTLLTGIVSLCY